MVDSVTSRYDIMTLQYDGLTPHNEFWGEKTVERTSWEVHECWGVFILKLFDCMIFPGLTGTLQLILKII